MRYLIALIVLCTTTGANAQNIIPKPYYYKSYGGRKFTIENTRIMGLSSDSFYTLDYIRKFFNSNEQSDKLTRIDISVDLQPEAHEAYQIRILYDVIYLTGGRAGVYYGLQTIKQLSEKNALEVADIIDFPFYKYRGMHLDVSRHFFTIEEIKKYIDMMARYKFNRFHWHLTDDQGWRIEIKKYPNLTIMGSQRKETIIGRQKNNAGDGQYDKTPHGGYYTQDQIREIVAYAQESHIYVVPEIEMPGHCLAAIASYPYLSCTGKPVEVGTRWGVYEDVYCAGKESTFEFLQNVLEEVTALFPGAYVHIGGDEVMKNNWKKCILCQKRIRENHLKDENELQSYFIRRIENYLHKKDKQMIGWDEILEGGLAPNATVMSWRGVAGGIQAAKMHHLAIMTPGKPCYFDHAQSRNPNEPLNIGGKNSYIDVYNYCPNPAGEVLDSISTFIIGAQGNVWTEYIADWEKLEYMILPRMVALSEVVWTMLNQKNLPDFQQRLGDELEVLDKKGIRYRIPEPLGFFDTLRVDQPYHLQWRPLTKNHTLEASLDNVKINNDAVIQPVNRDRKLKIRVKTGNRASIEYESFIPSKN